MVVDFDGRVLAQADPGPGEKVVVAPIDIDALRAERARRRGHDMVAHLRREIHGLGPGPGLAPAAGHPIERDEIESRIAAAKRALAGGER